MLGAAEKTTHHMNTSITFPPQAPILKLNRPSADKWAASLVEERRRLHEDQEALREREANLREYEARLRALQSEIEEGRREAAPARTASTVTGHPFRRPSSGTPFPDDAALQAAWEKLHRARELFESEQTHLRSERIAVQETQENMARRNKALAELEANLSEREASLVEREALLAEAVPPSPAAGDHSLSAVTRLTRAPFNMARSVFGGRR